MKNFAVRRSLLRVFLIFMLPDTFQNGNTEQLYQNGPPIQFIENYMNINGRVEEEEEDDHQVENNQNGGGREIIQMTMANVRDGWFEEEIEPDFKSCLALNSVEHQVASEIQHLMILDTKPFGKALVIDGHLQTTLMDEFIYHESLAHPALLVHDEPKTVFIMGGGGGSTAREVLKHRGIEKVTICDVDFEVVYLCRERMMTNQEAFNDPRLQIVFSDARDELERAQEIFDVILGDISEPGEHGPSNHLYTRSFYEQVAKPKLKENGIFVTLAGPAGIFSHKDVFSKIYNTLKQVFTHVGAYTTQMPSYRDSCGWIMASDEPLNFDAEQLNNRISERIMGELRYLDGDFIAASTILNKTLKTSLMKEEFVITEENVGLVQGRGTQSHCNA